MSADPYASPETSAASSTPPPIAQKPSRLIVFGILHIVGAVIGFGGLIVNFAQGDPKDAFVKVLERPGIDATFNQEALNALDPIVKYNQPLVIGSFIVAVFLLLSGIGLMKSTTWSLKFSNIYSALSLILKAIILVLAVVVLLPAYNEFFDLVTGMEPSKQEKVRIIMIGGLFFPLIIIIYPILSFILLNKKVVKDHLGVS